MRKPRTPGNSLPAPKKTIVVSGDIVVDHHVYGGERALPITDGKRGVRVARHAGGAAMLSQLIERVRNEGSKQASGGQHSVDTDGTIRLPKPATPWENFWQVRLGVAEPPIDALAHSNHAFGIWRPFPRVPADLPQPAGHSKSEKVWRLADRMGYGEPAGASDYVLKRARPRVPAPDVLVLDDGGFQFRRSTYSGCWHLPARRPGPTWILLKMSGPLAQGELWHRLIDGSPDRLVCLVGSDDLRREKLNLGEGLSWERTVEDLSFALRSITEGRELAKCAHLVVTFSTDGALWIDRTGPEGPIATLVYDASGADGEFVRSRLPGEVVGLQTVMAAALALALAHNAAAPAPNALDLTDAIGRGLNAMRDLVDLGHGTVGTDTPNGFPLDRLTKTLLKPWDPVDASDPFGSAKLRWPLIDPPKWWMFINLVPNSPGDGDLAPRPVQRPSLFWFARHLLTHGMTRLLKYLPHARFGDLVTADRHEIESLRNIQRLMRQYKDRPGSKPLSIGVFGPPGAGKSFGVKQVASQIFGRQVANKGFEETAWLEFNLSQFTPPTDLIGALHQVRDRALTGVIPVVFWDEFDSRGFEWLQYLLAPMQDGRFQEVQISHPVGRCVFIFAGGTSESFADFAQLGEAGDAAARDFRLRKGPDFRSRIDAYYDVLGPNQRLLPLDENWHLLSLDESWPERRQPDPTDLAYVLRRALMILNVLRTEGPLADADEGLLNALLRVPRYVNGARSLEKLVQPLGTGGDQPIRRSRLPAPSQIAMHVHPLEEFHALLNSRLGIEGLVSIDPESDWLEDPT
jgi:hypothetical protein